MVFRKGGYLGRAEKWTYNGQEVEVVNNYKYLGYTLSTKLSVDVALAEYVGRAKGKIVDITRTIYSLGSLDKKIYFKLFDAQVKPMLLYASEIWGITRNSTIESAHLFVMKRYLGVSRKTPNNLVYGETGRYPLYINSMIRAIKYWFRLLNMTEDRIPRIAYERERREEQKIQNWAIEIKRCLDRYGFSEIWTQQRVNNENGFLKELKQRMIDGYRQEWHDKIMNRDRFITYRSFKDTHQTETYLSQINIAKFRKAMTRLRLGVNELRINRKYTDNIAITTCPFCTAEETDAFFNTM